MTGRAAGRTRLWVWLPALTLTLAACASGASLTRNQLILLEPARAAEQRGDYRAAFEIYRGAAEDGIAYAQYRVGRMYQAGAVWTRTLRPPRAGIAPPRTRATCRRSAASRGCTRPGTV